jgi:glucose 1-dehydrogenase
MGILNGKVVVITGSSRGLGLAMAQGLTAEGAGVVLSSRSVESVEKAVQDLRQAGAQASGIACNVADLEQVEALAAHALEAFGHFDVWINNAGVPAPYGPTMHVPPEQFVEVVQTNILGTYYGSLVALRNFYPRNSGKLINILGRGDTGPVPFQNAYTASKIWVKSFTTALAAEYRATGLGIYAYNPGLMTTEFLTHVRAVAGYEKRLQPLKMVMRLWGNPPEVPAQRAVWLASSATDGKTGLIIKQLGPIQLAGGLLREATRRLLGQPQPEMPLQVDTVQPAMPLRPEATEEGAGAAPGLPLAGRSRT